MNRKDLEKALMYIQSEAWDRQRALQITYALEHNPVKEGDVVADDRRTIRVEKINVTGDDTPCCRYIGVELNRKGKEKKRQQSLPLFQRYIKTINGKPYKFDPTGETIWDS